MKFILFFTVLFYECNHLIFASISSSSESSSSLQHPTHLPINDKLLETAASINDPDPISSIDIDYLKNGLVFKFRRSIKSDSPDITTRRRSALDKNFMRFGRSNSKNLIRFGRSGSLMRFGRSDGKNMMRFGRNEINRMRFGRSDKNMMRFGRASNLMRFGRSGNLMRFGKRAGNLMRFGRAGGLMRFGRSQSGDTVGDDNSSSEMLNDQNDIETMANQQQQRLGEEEKDFTRINRINAKNMLRFGKKNDKLVKSFIRFGRNHNNNNNNNGETNDTDASKDTNNKQSNTDNDDSADNTVDDEDIPNALRILFNRSENDIGDDQSMVDSGVDDIDINNSNNGEDQTNAIDDSQLSQFQY